MFANTKQIAKLNIIPNQKINSNYVNKYTNYFKFKSFTTSTQFSLNSHFSHTKLKYFNLSLVSNLFSVKYCKNNTKLPQTNYKSYSTYSSNLYEPYRLHDLAIAKFNEGLQNEALEIIYDAIEKYPDQGFLYCFGGLLIDAREEYLQRAKTILENALAIYQDDITIKLNLAICLTLLRWSEQAIEYFMEVLEEEPENLEALHYLATAYLYTADYDLAKEVIYHKLELSYEPSGLANLYAILLAESQDTHDLSNCLIVLRQLLEMEPSYRRYILREAIGYGPETLRQITEVVHQVLGFHEDENPNPHPLLGTFHE